MGMSGPGWVVGYVQFDNYPPPPPPPRYMHRFESRVLEIFQTFLGSPNNSANALRTVAKEGRRSYPGEPSRLSPRKITGNTHGLFQ